MALPRERWLQTLWGRTDWSGWSLYTTEGESIHVLSTGRWNPDQGPDFLEAQVFIGQVFWIGPIELHVNSSDWFLHNHTFDLNYKSVVLHVVWKIDGRTPDLPTLELSRFVTVPQLRSRLHQWSDISQLACQRVMRPVDPAVWLEWRSELLQMRFHRKRTALLGDAPNSLRVPLARQLGAWVNRDVFESIDSSIPDVLFEWARKELHLITALYLGQGGLLQSTHDNRYLSWLSVQYQLIRRACSINPPYKHLLWMRIRPAANPMFRLAQLAALLKSGWMERSTWLRADVDELEKELLSLEMHREWIEASTTPALSVPHSQFISNGVVAGLLINIWAYLNATNADELAGILHGLSVEDNRITRLFEGLSLQQPKAVDSQAMMELYTNYCQVQRCGACRLAKCWIQDQPPQSI